MKDQYKFWVDWRLGIINRKLTVKEEEEVRASEFAMHLLFPIAAAEKMINQYGITIFENRELIKMVSHSFGVPYEAVVFQLQNALSHKKLEEETKPARR